MPLTNPNFPTKSELLGLINQYLVTNGTILATEHNEIETALVNAIYGGQVGDIKEIAANDAYIVANFQTGTSNINEGLGLVNGERYGWAICNGKNGTINKMGKVAIGYDPINYTLGTVAGGNTGGEKTHTLSISEMPQHNHQVILHDVDDLNFNADFNYTGPVGLNGTTATINGPFIVGSDNSSSSLKRNVTPNSPGDILYSGGGSSHNNMQPYLVTLFIQRIAPY